MTTIAGTPVSYLQPLKLTPSQILDPAEAAAKREEAAKLAAGPTPAERAAQIAKQNAVEAHTTFRVNGKIVAVQARDGGTTIPSGSDFGAIASSRANGGEQGLAREAVSDRRAEFIEKALKQKYGASLEVIRHEPGKGPTMDELNAEMFGKPNEAALVAASGPKVDFDADTLAMLSRIQQSQVARVASLDDWLNGKD